MGLSKAISAGLKKIAVFSSGLAILGLTACNKCDCTAAKSDCAADTSSIALIISTPPGITGSITVNGPNNYVKTLNASDTLNGLAKGAYTVTANRVKVAGTMVGKAYSAKVWESSFVLTACAPKTDTIKYALEPGSEKLWVADGTHTKLYGFAAADLAATGSPTPAVSLGTPPSPNGVTFDSHGNLWFCHAEGVSMFAMEDLGNSAAVPRVVLSGTGVSGTGLPGASALAFDDDGSLWISQKAANKIVKLTAGQIAATGTPTPAIVISSADLDGTESIAFDAEGNLWVASEAVLKFGRAHLAASYSGAADARIVHRTGLPVINVITTPNTLAFDKEGQLWITYFSGSQIIPLAKSHQAVSDTLTPAISINGDALALVEGSAIDEAGGFWVPGKAGQILRVAPAGLLATGDLAAAVTLTPSALAYASNMAFDPAPPVLPLRQ